VQKTRIFKIYVVSACREGVSQFEHFSDKGEVINLSLFYADAF